MLSARSKIAAGTVGRAASLTTVAAGKKGSIVSATIAKGRKDSISVAGTAAEGKDTSHVFHNKENRNKNEQWANLGRATP